MKHSSNEFNEWIRHYQEYYPNFIKMVKGVMASSNKALYVPNLYNLFLTLGNFEKEMNFGGLTAEIDEIDKKMMVDQGEMERRVNNEYRSLAKTNPNLEKKDPGRLRYMAFQDAYKYAQKRMAKWDDGVSEVLDKYEKLFKDDVWQKIVSRLCTEMLKCPEFKAYRKTAESEENKSIKHLLTMIRRSDYGYDPGDSTKEEMWEVIYPQIIDFRKKLVKAFSTIIRNEIETDILMELMKKESIELSDVSFRKRIEIVFREVLSSIFNRFFFSEERRKLHRIKVNLVGMENEKVTKAMNRIKQISDSSKKRSSPYSGLL